MEAKKRLNKIFYWLDTKLVWLFHFPKPVDWEEFDRKMQEAIDEDKRRYLADLKEAKLIGIKEVVDWVKSVMELMVTVDDDKSKTEYGTIKLLEWQAKLKNWGIKED